MKTKFFMTILANLIFGNLILYIHEIYGRQQDEVSPRLWLSFSFVSIVLLIFCLKLIENRKSWMFNLILSLGFSIFVPVVGFFVGMGFSITALFLGSAYLFHGFFYLIFPMFLLNFILFQWNHRA